MTFQNVMTVLLILINFSTFFCYWKNNVYAQKVETSYDKLIDHKSKNPPYLRLPIEGEIGTIDPGLTFSTPSIEITEQLFIGLTGLDPKNYEPVPELATHWTVSEDGKTYTFFMRKDVLWTNGDPVTANDVVWAIQRNIDPKTKSAYSYVLFILKNAEAINSGKIKKISKLGVRAIDKYTVEFKLKYPAAFFPSMAGLWVYRPLPKDCIDKHGDEWTYPHNIITNGSYMLSEWIEGSIMILKKNPKYFAADKVKISQVQYYIVPESYAGLVMYENNDLDITGGNYLRLPIDEIPKIKTNPIFVEEYSNQPHFCTYYYGFNTKRPPMDNPLVRKALSAAIDRNLLIEVITRGEEHPATTFTRPPIFGSVDPTKKVGIGFDPIQAKKWMADAGYPNGKGFPILELMHNTSETHAKITKTFQTYFKYYLNIDIKIQALEWGKYVNALNKPESESPHIFRWGWCADYPDANNYLNEVFHPTKSGNMIRWESKEFAQLMDNAQKNPDPKARKQMYHRAEQILCEEQVGIMPIFYETAQYLVKPRVKGWYHMGLGGQHIRNWYLEDDIQSEKKESNISKSSSEIFKSKVRLPILFGYNLNKKYYGNSIWMWLLSMVLISLALMAGNILYWFSKNIVNKLTAKTKSNLDDIILDMTEEPVVFVGVLISLWYSLKILTLPLIAEKWIGNIFYILIVFNIAWFISRTVDALVEHYIVPLTQKTETDLDDIILPIARNAFQFIVWTIALIIGMNNAGINVGSIIAGFGIGGIAIAMAAENTLTNILGGAILMIFQPFAIGDRIIIMGYDAVVKEIGLRSTSLIEISSRRLITIPNSVVSNEPIVNVSLEKRGRWISREFKLSVNNSAKLIKMASELVQEVITKHENTLFGFAFFDNNNDFSFGLKFKYSILKASFFEVTMNDIHIGIRRKFEERGIKFASI